MTTSAMTGAQIDHRCYGRCKINHKCYGRCKSNTGAMRGAGLTTGPMTCAMTGAYIV